MNSEQIFLIFCLLALVSVVQCSSAENRPGLPSDDDENPNMDTGGDDDSEGGMEDVTATGNDNQPGGDGATSRPRPERRQDNAPEGGGFIVIRYTSLGAAANSAQEGGPAGQAGSNGAGLDVAAIVNGALMAQAAALAGIQAQPVLNAQGPRRREDCGNFRLDSDTKLYEWANILSRPECVGFFEQECGQISMFQMRELLSKAQYGHLQPMLTRQCLNSFSHWGSITVDDAQYLPDSPGLLASLNESVYKKIEPSVQLHLLARSAYLPQDFDYIASRRILGKFWDSDAARADSSLVSLLAPEAILGMNESRLEAAILYLTDPVRYLFDQDDPSAVALHFQWIVRIEDLIKRLIMLIADSNRAEDVDMLQKLLGVRMEAKMYLDGIPATNNSALSALKRLMGVPLSHIVQGYICRSDIGPHHLDSLLPEEVQTSLVSLYTSECSSTSNSSSSSSGSSTPLNVLPLASRVLSDSELVLTWIPEDRVRRHYLRRILYLGLTEERAQSPEVLGKLESLLGVAHGQEMSQFEINSWLQLTSTTTSAELINIMMECPANRGKIRTYFRESILPVDFRHAVFTKAQDLSLQTSVLTGRTETQDNSFQHLFGGMDVGDDDSEDEDDDEENARGQRPVVPPLNFLPVQSICSNPEGEKVSKFLAASINLIKSREFESPRFKIRFNDQAATDHGALLRSWLESLTEIIFLESRCLFRRNVETDLYRPVILLDPQVMFVLGSLYGKAVQQGLKFAKRLDNQVICHLFLKTCMSPSALAQILWPVEMEKIDMMRTGKAAKDSVDGYPMPIEHASFTRQSSFFYCGVYTTDPPLPAFIPTTVDAIKKYGEDAHSQVLTTLVLGRESFLAGLRRFVRQDVFYGEGAVRFIENALKPNGDEINMEELLEQVEFSRELDKSHVSLDDRKVTLKEALVMALRQLPANLRLDLLAFWSGTRQLPITGLSGLRLKAHGTGRIGGLFSTTACYNTLRVPQFSTMAELTASLHKSIVYGVLGGFNDGHN